MSHFARIDSDNKVVEVLVIEQDVIDTGLFGDPKTFVQTSYNTRGGVHYGQDGQPDGGVALRGNYAGIGYVYDKTNDVFYPEKPYASWILNTTNWSWEAPSPMPSDAGTGEPPKMYSWNENTTSWVVIG